MGLLVIVANSYTLSLGFIQQVESSSYYLRYMSKIYTYYIAI